MSIRWERITPRTNLRRLHTAASVLDDLDGWFGMIGPDIQIPASNHSRPVKSLYELFTGDGMIQGVFLDGRGQLTPMTEYVNTEKREYEARYGKLPTNLLVSIFTYCLYKLGLAPNLLGFANTALGHIQQRLYAFYERDMPYLLDLDFENRTIRTVCRVPVDKLEMCSGHTKYDAQQKVIHTMEYDVYHKKVQYAKVDPTFRRVLHSTTHRTHHIPVIHDFLVLSERILFMDSPYRFDFGLFVQSKIPVRFDSNQETYIHILDISGGGGGGEAATYRIPAPGIALFHFADVSETPISIEILASIYESIRFDDLFIVGKYRKLVIDKRTGNVMMIQSADLEKYNLDFPVSWVPDSGTKRIILRNFDGTRNNGFVIVEGMHIVRELWFDRLSISGEPVVCQGSKGTYLLSFAYDSALCGYLIAVHLDDPGMFIEEIPLNMSFGIGFHSIFVDAKN